MELSAFEIYLIPAHISDFCTFSIEIFKKIIDLSLLKNQSSSIRDLKNPQIYAISAEKMKRLMKESLSKKGETIKLCRISSLSTKKIYNILFIAIIIDFPKFFTSKRDFKKKKLIALAISELLYALNLIMNFLSSLIPYDHVHGHD